MNLDLKNTSKTELVQLLLAEQERAKLHEEAAKNYKLENDWLRHQLAQLRRMKFGSTSERFEANNNQLVLPFEEYASLEEKQDETPVKETITYEREKKKKKHNGRNVIPEHLPVVEHTVEPLEDVTGMKKIGEVRTEILEYTPEKFFKLVIVRPKYARLEKDQIINVDKNSEEKSNNVVIAQLPSRPIDKCLAGNDLLAFILIYKYIDHLPLYRQQQIFKRSDIEIAPSTIDSWVAQLGSLFKPLYDRLKAELKAQTYLQADETTIKVLDKQKKGKTHTGYFWVYHAPVAKLAVFDYQRGRDIKAPIDFLKGHKGFLQTDGYNVYEHYYNNDNITHLACWAHARRKFENALSNDKKRAEHVLVEIQKLYAIERAIKDLSNDERKKMRLEKALPIINDLGKWLAKEKPQLLPKSPIGKAVSYTADLWDSLQSYLYDGSLHIDNNLIENAIRPVALGRKNYLFAGSDEGAKRSAMFYSFFACCKLNNINPQKWIRYVLANIADCKSNKLHELLPNNINPEKLDGFKHFWEV